MLHPDNQRFVSLSTNRKIAIHAMRDGRELANLEQEGNYNKPIAFSHDGRQLIILRDGGYMQTLNSDDWTLDKKATLESVFSDLQQELKVTP
jgi:hypothetical protein